MENYWSYSLTVFMAFFAIMNPLVNIPIFVKITEGIDAKKKKAIAKTANIVAFIIVVAFILVGKYIFEIFGLTIPSFKVFGGVLIFYIGFDMLQTKKTSLHLKDKPVFDASIMAGPGTIVTGMNFVVDADFLKVSLTILIFALIILCTYLAFIYSNYLVRIVGENNFVIIGKIMGIIIGVLGANMLIEGIKLAFNI